MGGGAGTSCDLESASAGLPSLRPTATIVKPARRPGAAGGPFFVQQRPYLAIPRPRRLSWACGSMPQDRRSSVEPGRRRRARSGAEVSSPASLPASPSSRPLARSSSPRSCSARCSSSRTRPPSSQRSRLSARTRLASSRCSPSSRRTPRSRSWIAAGEPAFSASRESPRPRAASHAPLRASARSLSSRFLSLAADSLPPTYSPALATRRTSPRLACARDSASSTPR